MTRVAADVVSSFDTLDNVEGTFVRFGCCLTSDLWSGEVVVRALIVTGQTRSGFVCADVPLLILFINKCKSNI